MAVLVLQVEITKMTNEYAQMWWAKESPSFSFRCECGLMITGQSEKGVFTLVKRHKEKGTFHIEYAKDSNDL